MAKSYAGITFKSATFPDSPYKDVAVKLNPTILNEYIPALGRALPNASKGLRLLLTVMTYQEGFKKGSRSYRNNNPGNIGNTDSSANKKLLHLEDGIVLQANFITDIIAGKKAAFPMNKPVIIPPFYSPEIAKNEALYGINPNLPGYSFTFTGQLDQFIKIYSTGARATNSYLNCIVSYFKLNGLVITPQTTLGEIVGMG